MRTLPELPDDIINEIFRHIHTKDLLPITLICKTLCEQVQNEIRHRIHTTANWPAARNMQLKLSRVVDRHIYTRATHGALCYFTEDDTLDDSPRAEKYWHHYTRCAFVPRPEPLGLAVHGSGQGDPESSTRKGKGKGKAKAEPPAEVASGSSTNDDGNATGSGLGANSAASASENSKSDIDATATNTLTTSAVDSQTQDSQTQDSQTQDSQTPDSQMQNSASALHMSVPVPTPPVTTSDPALANDAFPPVQVVVSFETDESFTQLEIENKICWHVKGTCLLSIPFLKDFTRLFKGWLEDTAAMGKPRMHWLGRPGKGDGTKDYGILVTVDKRPTVIQGETTFGITVHEFCIRTIYLRTMLDPWLEFLSPDLESM